MSNLNESDSDYLKKNGPMMVVKIVFERMKNKKDHGVPDKEEIKILNAI